MPSKAVSDATNQMKESAKSGIRQGTDIYTGDDQTALEGSAEQRGAAVPEGEPKLSPNTPQVKNAPPPGAQGVRGAGGGRGSSGGGGGRMLKNRRMMQPMEMANPDYSFKLMARGGPVERTLTFAKGGSVKFGQDYRKGK